MSNPRPQLTDDQDAELAQYRALSTLAVVGLIWGLLAPLAMIHPLLWGAPLLGILFSGLALRRIARYAPALVGRKAALLGLTLSLLFGTAAPANRLVYRWLVRREGRQFAFQWFGFLARGQPQKAYQLTLAPKYRQPLDDKLWDFYREGPRWQEELEHYVARPLVRTLLALGEQARASGEPIRSGPTQVAMGEKAVVRYYQTTSQWQTGEGDRVVQVYAVTYQDDQGDERKTFFVALNLQRVKLETGRANWHLDGVRDGFRPPGL